ncbi:hypothetical protein [Colwellia sp.]|uniref:hypothetical protein n=1 Tax=Colwellia sp. TaxID=56799 RepID=UPI0025BB008A|nr:hypothetical protein [Colwellia sp.]
MIEKYMALKTDFRHFLDEAGNVVELTKQAKTIFKFLSKIVSAVSENIEQPMIDVDLNCNTRAEQLSCGGSIEGKCSAIDMIEWHCDTCEASGTISNWQGSLWDKQARILH